MITTNIALDGSIIALIELVLRKLIKMGGHYLPRRIHSCLSTEKNLHLLI